MSISRLWPHQERGIADAPEHLKEYGGTGLWWEMRTGKSRTATQIALNTGARRILVIAPKGVVDNDVWGKEARALVGEIPVTNLTADSTVRKAAMLRATASGIVVVNWDSAWRTELAAAITDWAPDVVIADEAHWGKSPSSRRSKFMATIPQKLPDTLRISLSGTPFSHSPLDAWAIYRFLAPTIFEPTYTAFKARYLRPAHPSEWRDQDIHIEAGRGGALLRYKYTNLDDLNERIYRCATRVRTDDVIDQTEATTERIVCRLEPSAMQVYRDLEREMISELRAGEFITADNALTRTLRLQQITGGAVSDEDRITHVVSTAKQSAIEEWFDALGDEPAVVFARFKHDMAAVHAAAAAAGKSSLELSGSRHELQQWQDGAAQVLVVQPRSGGAGIDLTRSRLAAWYSLSYSLDEYDQALMRVRGPMQTRPVGLYHFVAAGTIDEAIYDALDKRRDVIASVVDRLRAAV